MVREHGVEPVSSVEEGLEATWRLVAGEDLEGVSGVDLDGEQRGPHRPAGRRPRGARLGAGAVRVAHRRRGGLTAPPRTHHLACWDELRAPTPNSWHAHGPGRRTTPTRPRGPSSRHCRERCQRRAAGPVRRDPGVRNRRSAGCARCRPQPDEPRRRASCCRRPRGVPRGPRGDVRGLRRDRVRRSPQLRRLRARHRRGDDRGGPPGGGARRPAAHPAAGLRDEGPRLRGRGDGDGQPQPAAGQRLQGLPRRRQPDRAPGRRGDRRADRRGRRGRRHPARLRRPGRPVLGDEILDRYLARWSTSPATDRGS